MGIATTIYADYQATTPVDPRVVEQMAPYWNGSFGNPHSSDHVVGWSAAETVRGAAASVSTLIGSDSDEVVFTSGATEANNLALLGLGRRAPAGRRRILVSAIEHKCVLASARALEDREDFSVEVIPVDADGLVRLDVLEDMVDESVLVASIMVVNNEIGTIQDVRRIGELLRRHGVLFHCDAAQAPCAVDVGDLAAHADLVSLSGHKLYGPKGIGALYVRREFHDRIEPLFYGGGQQRGLRSGTTPVPLCVGMAAAADIVRSEDRVVERERVSRLRDSFVQGILNSPVTAELNGPTDGKRHPGNANVRFQDVDAEDLLGVLQPRLAASTGSACGSGIPEPSHVLRALGLSEVEARSSVRFSFGRFTTQEDVDTASDLVRDALGRL
ncbi:MAG: cysteine desulfurase family protein [Caldilineaceae bacterium]|nr:cysteine desulfurase family protein [Caldilineaceae bacterium]